MPRRSAGLRGWIVPAWTARLPRRRAALGFGSSAAPGLGYVLTGVALGPRGLGILSADVLGSLDAVISVALAALGVLVGFGLGDMARRRAGGLLASATVEATITIAVVAGAMLVLLPQWEIPLPIDARVFAVLLGLCTCASAALRVDGRDDDATRNAARIAELDDLPLIVLGGVTVAAIGGQSGAAVDVLLTLAAAVMVAIAAWLLVGRTRDEAEHGVFVAGAVVLLAGAARYLGSSPLLAGLAAALVWVRAPGEAHQRIRDDVRSHQHSFVALLLLLAGASIQWTLALLWVAAPLLLFRLTGKLVAGVATARLAHLPPLLLARALVPPGVVGIALALDLQQVLDGSETLLVSGVVVAAAATELLATLLGLDAPDPAPDAGAGPGTGAVPGEVA
jgi:hypothetical protein